MNAAVARSVQSSGPACLLWSPLEDGGAERAGSDGRIGDFGPGSVLLADLRAGRHSGAGESV